MAFSTSSQPSAKVPKKKLGEHNMTKCPFETATSVACEKIELIIEIVGNIPTNYDDQRIIICNKDDRYDEALTNKVNKDKPIDDGKLASALHRWEWEAEQQAHLWLEIKTIEGNPIRIPMLNGQHENQKALATSLKAGLHTQDNLIVPIVPVTELLTYRHLLDRDKEIAAMTQATPVLCRAGWLYIFKTGKLWREIAIKQDEKSGVTSYHDVSLHGQNGCLDTKGFVPSDKERKAIGIGLEEIWIPARWNTFNESIQLFYAESQLTPQRLNAYLKDPSLLAKRSHFIPSMLPSSIKLDQNNSNQTAPHITIATPFLLGGANQAQPHIPRDIEREMLLQNPTAFLKNSQQINNVFEESQVFYQEMAYPTIKNNGIPEYNNKELLNTNQYILPENISAHAWAYHIKAKLNEELCKGPPTEIQLKDPDSPWNKYDNTSEDKALWAQTQASKASLTNKEKALKKAIDKKICGLYVFDPLYWLAHLHTLIQHHWTLQKLLPDIAAFRSHHGSAFLVENIMREVGVQDQNDPRYKAVKDNVTGTIKQRVDFALGNSERTFTKNRIKLCQELLYKTLSQGITEQAIKDTTSCSGWDKFGGCAYLASLLNSFVSPNLTDPLASPSSAKEDYPLEQKAAKLISQGNPYYRVLYQPKEDTTQLLDPYQKPTIIKVEPKGDGLWQPEVMTSLEKTSDSELTQLITEDKLATLQGNIHVMKSDLGLDLYEITTKAVGTLAKYANNIGNIIRNLSSQETAKQAEIENIETTADNLEAEERRLQNEQQELKNQLTDVQKQQTQLKTQLNTIDNDINTAENQKRQLIEKHAEAINTVNQRIAQLKATLNAITVTDSIIMSWQGLNNEEKALQDIVINKKTIAAKQQVLNQKRDALVQQEISIKEQMELKQQEIAQVKERIQSVRNDATANKRLTVSAGKPTYVSLDLARELINDSLGQPKLLQETSLSLDEFGKVQLAEGEWVAIGIFDDELIDGVGDGRRRNVLNAEIALAKLDEKGNVIGPRDISKSQLQAALADSKSVVVRGNYIGFNRKGEFYKKYRKAIRDLKLALADIHKGYQNLASTRVSVLNSIETVDQEIAELQKQYGAYVKEQIDLTNAYEQKQIDQKQQALEQATETRDKLAEDMEANQRRIDELKNRETQTIQEREELKQRQSEIEQQRQQLKQQITECETKRTELSDAKAQLNDELKTIEQRKLRLQGNSLFSNFSSKTGRLAAIGAYKANAGLVKVMQHPVVPPIMLGFEVFNIISFINKLNEQGKSYRLGVEFFSLAMNVAAAIEGVTAVMAADKVLYEAKFATKSVVRVPKMFRAMGIKVLSVRFLLQGPAALITAGISAWDICDDIANQDWGALTGDLIILGGAITGLVATLMGAGGLIVGSIISWLVIISFALFFIGSCIKAIFADTPFDQWLKFGPFTDQVETGYQHLQQEEVAFYRLLDMLANLQFTVQFIDERTMSAQQWALFTGGEKRPECLVAASLTTSMPGLLTTPKEYYLVGDIRVGLPDPMYGRSQEIKQPDYYYQQITNMGVSFFLDASSDMHYFLGEEMAENAERGRSLGYSEEEIEQRRMHERLRYLVRFQLKFLDNKMNKWLLPFKKVALKTHTIPTKENEVLPDVKPLFFYQNKPDYWFTESFDQIVTVR